MKFLYLKELVDLKVRLIIDVLLFNLEGYFWVKNILIIKYGKESEIINVYVINIMLFLVI